MTGSVFHAVAPVSALCAAFLTQPSEYPPEATKPDVAPVCGSFTGTAGTEGNRLRAACGGGRSRNRRGRRKPRGRARTLADTSARSAGSLGLSDRGC